MKTFEKLSAFSAALLMTASMGSVYAEAGDVSQERTQDRVRTELNLQSATSDFGQSQNREEHTVMNQNQNQYQYQYRNKNQNGKSGSDEASAKNNIWDGYGTSSNMDRMNTTNRSMQGNTMTGSMNRYSAASRSTSGGRR